MPFADPTNIINKQKSNKAIGQRCESRIIFVSDSDPDFAQISEPNPACL
jgi:hypothetical protein